MVNALLKQIMLSPAKDYREKDAVHNMDVCFRCARMWRVVGSAPIIPTTAVVFAQSTALQDGKQRPHHVSLFGARK